MFRGKLNRILQESAMKRAAVSQCMNACESGQHQEKTAQAAGLPRRGTMSDDKNKKELQKELAEEAREEQEDLAGKPAEAEGSEEKIFETVTLPTDEVSQLTGEDGPEEKQIPDEADEEASGEEDPEQAESGGTAGQEQDGNRRSHNPFAAIGGWFRRMEVWERVIAVILIAALAVAVAGYGYFHSKYALMDYSTGEFHSDENISSAAEQSTQDQMENEELEKRQLVEEIPEQSVIESTQEVEKATGVVNILLIGTDDRTKKFSNNARGDTCILLSINRDQDKAHLVSFERATGVQVISGQYEGQWDWLTHMFWYGGPAMMTQEIRDNFKVDVTKYIRVNIYTFMELLESIDGVDIELTQAEADNLNHPGNTYTAGNERRAIALGYPVQTDLTAGMNHLDPGTAMCYARLRAIDDDWHRVVRQRKVILAAIEKLKTMSLTELDRLLNNVLPLVQTNLTETDVAGLLPDAVNFVNMDYDSITFPLRHTYGLMDGMEGRRVLAVDFDTNSQELQDLLYGNATTEELTAKYENTPSDYNYKDSDTYQKNYQDAESAVGRSTSIINDPGVSATSGAVGDTAGTASAGAAAGAASSAVQAGISQSAGADSAAGTDAAAGQPDPVSSTVAGGAGNASAGTVQAGAGTSGTAAAVTASGSAAGTGTSGTAGTATGTAASGTAVSAPASGADAAGSSGTGSTAGGASGGSSSLGKVLSTSTDPATGVVTTIYYNEATGVRTVTATHPSSGATTVSRTDTATGDTQTVHTDAWGNVTTETSNTGTSAPAAGAVGNAAAGQPSQ